MRYLVTARVKQGRERALRQAIEDRTLGAGSIAAGEFLRNVAEARRVDDGTVKWVEVCYCPDPLAEERPYWEEYFELLRVKDAHARDRCRHEQRERRYACDSCDCTERLDARLRGTGTPFLETLPDPPKR